MKHFQHKEDRSDSSHAMLGEDSRRKKARKIRDILNQVTDIKCANLLDIGTGSGHIAHELSKTAARVSSIDVVDERKVKLGYSFRIALDETLPYKSDSFDIVVTNHVVEHTPNQLKHLDEAIRVLKPGGYLYLATPNRWWLTDPHYKLPFISWLPRKVGTLYLRAVQQKEWDVYPLSSRKIRRQMSGHLIQNGLPLVSSAGASDVGVYVSIAKVMKKMPKSIIRMSEWFSPTLIYLVQKTQI